MITDRDARTRPQLCDGELSVDIENVLWQQETVGYCEIEEKYKSADRRIKAPDGTAVNPSKGYEDIITPKETSEEPGDSLEYAVPPVKQTKSATDNNGNFSLESGRIPRQDGRKSSIGDYLVEKICENDAKNILSDIEKNQTENVERESLTKESWHREFEGYAANTVIGEVKLGEHQYQKLLAKGREDTWAYIKPTLERPSLLISEVNEEVEETGCYNFIKAFNEDGNTRWYYSVVVTKDNDGLFSISNRRIHRKQIANKLIKHLRAYSASGISEERRKSVQHPQHTSVLNSNIDEKVSVVKSISLQNKADID